MEYHTYDELIEKVKSQPRKARVAVAAAGDSHTLEAVLRARDEGIATPVLVGDKAQILSPKSAKDEYLSYLENVMKKYQK